MNAADAFARLNRRLLDGMLKPLREGAQPPVAEILRSLAAGVAENAEQWLAINQRYYAGQMALWRSLIQAPAPGDAPARSPLPEPDDPRFRDEAWRAPYFDYLVRSYLLRAQWLREVAAHAPLEPHARKKLLFLVRQWIDATSPANFPGTNPEALKLAFDTGGESLARGLKNLEADLDRGLVSMTDERAFELGRNLAVTPGAVVYENDYFQLLQYRPLTDAAYERPLLMVPPFINKYYVLDLQPQNSFVRFAVEQGHTVFMMSWRNMPPAMGHATWDDYLGHGVLEAIALSSRIAGGAGINALGFCVGGTLLGSAMAVLRARGENPVTSLTLLAAMLDFGNTGELSVFVDEPYVSRREQDFAGGGILDGRELALTFASLRANDLIWRYVVNNYLKGRTPEPFDLLYWNADSTNLPGPMYVYYLRNMYLENNLRIPGKLGMCGTRVDLGTIDVPAYVLAAREDHIVPWQTAYASARLLGGKIDFVLAASGHIAGVINPAARGRRSYWVNDRLEEHPERWLAGAASQPGSWWTHWIRWLAPYGGRRMAARSTLGGGIYRELAAAPGSYVRERMHVASQAEANGRLF